MQAIERGPGVEVAAPKAGRASWDRHERLLAAALVLVVAVLVVVHVWARLGAPFGDSHDGRNAGVWAAGARSLREHGPVASRLGAVSPENGTYANHPPLLYVETAAAQLVSRSPAATRAPAWLGSLLALGLLAVLLRERGLSRLAVAAGVAAVAGSSMFLTYGTMPDTPVASLPFGVGLLVLWQRVRAGRRVHPVAAFTVAALAALAGWQSLLVAAVVGGWGLAVLARRRLPGGAVALVTGAATGATLLLAWLLWVGDGSLDFLGAQLRYRTTGSGSSSITELVSTQRAYLESMFGWGLVVASAVGVALAVVDRRTRSVAAAVLVVTVPYTLAFRTGAINHSYWNYWWLLLIAVGVAAAIDRAVPAIAARSARPWSVPVALAAAFAALAVAGALRPSNEDRTTRRGLAAGRLAADAHLAPEQRTAWFAGNVGEPAGWLALATRRPARPVTDALLPELAATRPHELVLFGQRRCDEGGPAVTYSWGTIGDLAHRPPVPTSCGD